MSDSIEKKPRFAGVGELFENLRRRWRKHKPLPVPPAQKATVVEMPILIPILRRDEDTKDPATETAKVLSELVADQGKMFWETGFEDGTRGQYTSGIDQLAGQYTEIIRAELLSEYRGRESTSATRTQILKEKLNTAQSELRGYNDHLKQMTSFQRAYPRAFSGWLAAIYLVLAVILTFCDIPLALKLTQRGFDLDLGVASIADFFTDPFTVVQQNWEVFILALGVALCTIYIKIYWDDKLERPVSTSGLPDTSNDPRMRDAKRWRGWIFALTLITVVVLGGFRFVWLEGGGPSESGDQAGNITLSGEVSQQGSSVSTTAPVDSVGIIGKTITILAFVLITVLFPIVGGICASLGTNCAQNRRELARSRMDCKRAEEAYHEAERNHLQAASDHANWQKSLDEYKAETWRDRIKGLLMSYYRHGYQRGYLTGPDLGGERDIFARTDEFRGRMIAHRIQDALQCHIKAPDVDNESKENRRSSLSARTPQ